jgi:hypothetical protein
VTSPIDAKKRSILKQNSARTLNSEGFEPGKEDPMTLEPGFVAAVLDGIEGTLEEVIERVEISELRASLDVLQSRVKALRVSIEPRQVRADSECCERPVATER